MTDIIAETMTDMASQAVTETTNVVIETVTNTTVIVLECITLVFSAVITVYYMYRKCIRTMTDMTQQTQQTELQKTTNTTTDTTQQIVDNVDEVTTDDCEMLSKSSRLVDRAAPAPTLIAAPIRSKTATGSLMTLSETVSCLDRVFDITESDIHYKTKSHSHTTGKRLEDLLDIKKIVMQAVTLDDGSSALQYSIRI